MKSRKKAAVLALFLGWIGAHRFYLNQGGLGVFYIMAFIFASRIAFPITFVLGWIDAIIFFFQSDEEFNKKYNSGRSYAQRSRMRNRNRMRRRQGPVSRRIQSQQRRKHISKKRNPFKLSGQKNLESFDLDRAIEDFNRSLEVDKNDAEVHFLLAKAHSLSEHVDETYEHLSKAVSSGMKDIKKFDTEDALAFIRIHDEWDRFVDAGYRRVKSGPVRKKSQASGKAEKPKDDKLLAQLNRLAELRKQGLITDEDFEIEKKRIMR